MANFSLDAGHSHWAGSRLVLRPDWHRVPTQCWCEQHLLPLSGLYCFTLFLGLCLLWDDLCSPYFLTQGCLWFSTCSQNRLYAREWLVLHRHTPILLPLFIGALIKCLSAIYCAAAAGSLEPSQSRVSPEQPSSSLSLSLMCPSGAYRGEVFPSLPFLCSIKSI